MMDYYTFSLSATNHENVSGPINAAQLALWLTRLKAGVASKARVSFTKKDYDDVITTVSSAVETILCHVEQLAFPYEVEYALTQIKKALHELLPIAYSPQPTDPYPGIAVLLEEPKSHNIVTFHINKNRFVSQPKSAKVHSEPPPVAPITAETYAAERARFTEFVLRKAAEASSSD